MPARTLKQELVRTVVRPWGSDPADRGMDLMRWLAVLGALAAVVVGAWAAWYTTADWTKLWIPSLVVAITISVDVIFPNRRDVVVVFDTAVLTVLVASLEPTAALAVFWIGLLLHAVFAPAARVAWGSTCMFAMSGTTSVAVAALAVDLVRDTPFGLVAEVTVGWAAIALTYTLFAGVAAWFHTRGWTRGGAVATVVMPMVEFGLLLPLAFVCAAAATQYGPSAVALIVPIIFTLHGMKSARLEISAVREDARTDALTGVGNRRALETDGTDAVRHALQSGGTVSMLMLDIDWFKQVNDTYGHDVGDDVLRAVAAHLTGFSDDGVYVPYRAGGEEFVLLTTADRAYTKFAEDGQAVLDRIRESDDPIHVTASAGGAQLVAVASADEVLEIEVVMAWSQLLRDADQQLYAAKESGRDRLTLDAEFDVVDLDALDLDDLDDTDFPSDEELSA